MSQYPPPTQPAYTGTPIAPQRMSAAAVTSLICGILGCFIITGIIAIITGIIGLMATKNPNVKGRGLAIAGLILGIITTVGSGGCLLVGGGTYFGVMKATEPAAQVVRDFTAAVSAGDAAKAAGYCDMTVVKQEEIASLVTIFQSWGKAGDVTLPARNLQTVNGVTTIEVTGIVDFGGTPKTVIGELRKQTDGSYKITSINYK